MQPREAVRQDCIARARGDELDAHRGIGLLGGRRLALEVGEAELPGVGEGVVLRQHGDGDLLPERDAMQALGLDREAHEGEVGVATQELVELFGLLDAQGLEGLVGAHGGLGGWQDRAVLMVPADVAPLLPERIVGADALHDALVSMLVQAGHRKDLT